MGTKLIRKMALVARMKLLFNMVHLGIDPCPDLAMTNTSTDAKIQLLEVPLAFNSVQILI